MLSRVIFDVQRDLVQNLHQRGGAALIKITSVLWVDNTFAVSAVVVDDRQKAVGCEKTHKSDITPFVLIFAVYQLNDTPDILIPLISFGFSGSTRRTQIGRWFVLEMCVSFVSVRLVILVIRQVHLLILRDG